MCMTTRMRYICVWLIRNRKYAVAERRLVFRTAVYNQRHKNIAPAQTGNATSRLLLVLSSTVYFGLLDALFLFVVEKSIKKK